MLSGHAGRALTIHTLIFPGPLPLSMNGRMHWRQERPIVAEIRDHTLALVRSHHVPAYPRVRVTLEWVVNDRRRRDGINACKTLKAMQDGIVLAGVIPDDTPEFMESVMPTVRFQTKADGLAHLALGIEPLAPLEPAGGLW